MRIFISAGEPSGDMHGGNLTRALRHLDPQCDIYGLGGPRMRAAGVDLLYPLAEHAIMGFIRVLGVVPALADVLDRVTAAWHRRRPDAVVLIDYPGFHWWVAARAKALEIPVISFVPPQIWGWASHRVKKMRRTFDQVLCALPFEEEWFRSRGLRTIYVGHPYFDELASRTIDQSFVNYLRQLPDFSARRAEGSEAFGLKNQTPDGIHVIGLLPGSRTHEVMHNLPLLLY